MTPINKKALKKAKDTEKQTKLKQRQEEQYQREFELCLGNSICPYSGHDIIRAYCNAARHNPVPRYYRCANGKCQRYFFFYYHWVDATREEYEKELKQALENEKAPTDGFRFFS